MLLIALDAIGNDAAGHPQAQLGLAAKEVIDGNPAVSIVLPEHQLDFGSSSGVNFGAMVTESRAFLKGSPHPKEHIDCGNDTDRDAGRPKHVLDHVPGLARPGLRHAGYIEGCLARDVAPSEFMKTSQAS